MKNPFAMLISFFMEGLQLVRTKLIAPRKPTLSETIQYAIQTKAEEKRQRKQHLRRQLLDRQTGRNGTMQ